MQGQTQRMWLPAGSKHLTAAQVERDKQHTYRYIPEWSLDNSISLDQAEQVHQDLAVQLEAWSVEGVCHDSKHLTHQLCVVALVELSGKVAGGKRLEQVLRRTNNNELLEQRGSCWRR